MSDPAIEIRGLRKRFSGGPWVLEGIDLAVEPGTIQGFIGPNGAGKSTTVKILCGLISDFEGEVRVAGCDPREDPIEVKRHIGLVPENAALFEVLTVAEYLLFVGRLKEVEDDVIRARGQAFLEVFELADRLGARIGELSKGMRQKVLLTSALLHDPRILFLDEPLSGLDVNASILIKEFVRRLADEGRTIFYCSHVMDVVERVCDRIAIVDGGGIVAQGTFDEIAAQRGGGSLERIFADLTSRDDAGARVERLIDALGS